MMERGNTMEQLLKQKQHAQDELDRIQRLIEQRESRTLVQCQCRLAFPIGELEYIQTQWYVPPHGCTGGDYWKDGEGRWKCPECGRVNRLYDKPDIEAKKWLFRSVVVQPDR